jgi:hypothetical protein
MNPRLHALVLVALCSAIGGIPPSQAAAQEGRITVKSTAPFGRVAEALECRHGREAEVQAVARELDVVFNTIIDRGVAGH